MLFKIISSTTFRGLVVPWKQIIYFQFSKSADRALIDNLIMVCEAADANVRAIVFDMGNHTIMKELKIFKDHNNSFPNPSDISRKVYVFCDVPHCMKNLRNHTLDDGMVIQEEDGSVVTLTTEDFESLLRADRGTFKRCHKLTMSHLYVRGSERQRVRPAVQLFSASVSKAMVPLLGQQFEEKAEVIDVVDKWFDVSNSRMKYDMKKAVRCGLGET